MFPAGKSPAGNLRFVELPPFFGYSFLLCAFPFVHSLFAHSLLPERILFGRSQHVRPIRSGSVLSVLRAVPGSFFGGGLCPALGTGSSGGFSGPALGCLVKRLWWTVLGSVPADVFLRWVVLCPALVNGSAGGAGEDGCE